MCVCVCLKAFYCRHNVQSLTHFQREYLRSKQNISQNVPLNGIFIMRLILNTIQMKEEDEKTHFFDVCSSLCVCVFAPEKLDVKVISHGKNEWRITVA